MKEILRDIVKNSEVQKMKGFIQHGKVSTYDHCRSVARMSLRLDKGL